MDQKECHVLTPIISSSKIPILVLIKHYCYHKLPQRCIPPILSKLVELITINPNATDRNQTANKELLTVYFPSLPEFLRSIEDAVHLFFNNSNQNNIKIEEDIRLIKHQILRELWDMRSYEDFFSFLESLSVLIIDPNTEFDSNILMLKSTPKPSKMLFSSSFFGSIIVSIGTAAIALTFEEGLKLWKAFIVYRQETADVWISLNGLNNGLCEASCDDYFESMVLPQAYVVKEFSKTNLYSTVDLSCLFQTQVAKLQKSSSTISKPLQKLLDSLSHSERSLIPSSYHIEYLNSWRNADYDESFDSLHRYFDYMMSNKRQYFYHYALLALASMHSSFGANQEALRAIDEAILVARENKDLDCLNYLLTWLLNFIISKPELFINSTSHPSRTEIINFLRSKTKETNNKMLQAITFQFEAVVAMLEGTDLTSVMENVTKSMFLILNLENVSDTKSRFLTTCQLFCGIWARIGYPGLAKLYLESAIDIARETDYEFDLGILYIRKAFILYFEGSVEEAFELLATIEDSSLKDFSMNKKWNTAKNILSFYACLKKCQYAECSIILARSEALSANFDDQDIANEIIYQRALLNFGTNNIDTGVKLLTDRITVMKDHIIVYNHFWFVRFQTLYAQSFLEYTKYPERGLSVLLNAINLTHRSSFIFNLCESILCLCKLIIKIDIIGSMDDVKSLLSEFLPKILQLKNIDMISTAYYLLAYVGYFEMKHTLKTDMSAEGIHLVLEHLHAAIEGYKRMSDYLLLKKTLELQEAVSRDLSMEELHQKTLYDLKHLEVIITNQGN